VVGDFEAEEAKRRSDAEWAAGGIDSSSQAPLYRVPDGREVPSNELPPGAMYDAAYLHDLYPMPDGICLMVVCPDGHHWLVDGPASNCTLPQDRAHRCWVRHGNPRCERVTVDKHGLTCQAGAGSILTPNYHGFLQGGVLTAG